MIRKDLEKLPVRVLQTGLGAEMRDTLQHLTGNGPDSV